MQCLKCVVLLTYLIQYSVSISSKSSNDTADILWNLSNIAIQSRQNHPNYPEEYYNKYPVNTHQGVNYHELPYAYSDDFYPPGSPLDQHQDIPKESLMNVLFSIARNDDLQCVPKLICELVTSGTITGRQQGVNLPININTESIIGLLSAFNNIQASPLLHFGKAALLGYASKGKTGSCNYAYPDCPSNPDKVLQYLNNHNGGFFRYFNGVNPAQSQHPVYFNKANPEQRIQNNPVAYIPSTISEQGIKFPPRDEAVQYVRPPKGLKFPSDEFNNELTVDDFSYYKTQGPLKFPVEDQGFRKPKELQFDHYEDQLDLQKPLPNHKAAALIFPVRTGTGDLRLDADELNDYKQPYLYRDEDVKIAFHGFNGVKDVHTTNNYLESSAYYERNPGRGFSFPAI